MLMRITSVFLQTLSDDAADKKSQFMIILGHIY